MICVEMLANWHILEERKFGARGGSYEEWPYDGHVFHEDDARGYSGGGINSKEKDPTAGIRLVFIPKGMEPSFYL